jgi:sphingolipid delta-4 desaturase
VLLACATYAGPSIANQQDEWASATIHTEALMLSLNLSVMQGSSVVTTTTCQTFPWSRLSANMELEKQVGLWSRLGVSTENAEFSASKQIRRKHPHGSRRAQLLRDHPEVSKLYGTNRKSALYVVLLVALQLFVGVGFVGRGHLPWYLAVVLAYVFGAVVDHAQWVLIHDATHNLIFDSVAWNRLILCVANTIHVVPSGMMFRYYHILHHIELNRVQRDPDVPAAWEARLVGNSRWRKALWLALFFVFQSLRLVSYSHRIPNGREFVWFGINGVMNLATIYGAWRLGGWISILYLTLSSIFSVGLHPLGARWIQEHYPTLPFQSTYSYYGWANRVAFNIGFHNEHHDLPSVPWNRLPHLKKLAPEYYDSLFAYRSYRKLLREFILDPRWSLLRRWEADLAAAEKERLEQQASLARQPSAPIRQKQTAPSDQDEDAVESEDATDAALR